MQPFDGYFRQSAFVPGPSEKENRRYQMSKDKESWLELLSVLIVCGVVGLVLLVLFGQLLYG